MKREDIQYWQGAIRGAVRFGMRKAKRDERVDFGEMCVMGLISGIAGSLPLTTEGVQLAAHLHSAVEGADLSNGEKDVADALLFAYRSQAGATTRGAIRGAQ